MQEEWIKENLVEKKELFMAFSEDVCAGRTCFNLGHHYGRELFFLGLNPWKPFTGDINSIEEVCKYCQQFPETQEE